VTYLVRAGDLVPAATTLVAPVIYAIMKRTGILSFFSKWSEIFVTNLKGNLNYVVRNFALLRFPLSALPGIGLLRQAEPGFLTRVLWKSHLYCWKFQIASCVCGCSCLQLCFLHTTVLWETVNNGAHGKASLDLFSAFGHFQMVTGLRDRLRWNFGGRLFWFCVSSRFYFFYLIVVEAWSLICASTTNQRFLNKHF